MVTLWILAIVSVAATPPPGISFPSPEPSPSRNGTAPSPLPALFSGAPPGLPPFDVLIQDSAPTGPTCPCPCNQLITAVTANSQQRIPFGIRKATFRGQNFES